MSNPLATLGVQALHLRASYIIPVQFLVDLCAVVQLARSCHATRRMDTRRVLVTGGGGFVGLKLCQELTRRGYKVTALDVKFLSDEALATEEDKNIDKVEV